VQREIEGQGAVVLFDPVSGTGPTDTDATVAKEAVAKICSPLLTLFAENHEAALSCNKKGLWKTFGLTSTGPRASAVIKDGSHCDGELPARDPCGVPALGCGDAADRARQSRLAHYATAWLLAHLEGDPLAKAEVQLARMTADATVHDAAWSDGVNCAAPPAADAGTTDAGDGGDAGIVPVDASAQDSGGSSGDAGHGPGGGGGGCAIGGSGDGAWWLFAIGLLYGRARNSVRAAQCTMRIFRPFRPVGRNRPTRCSR
jgi:uncharacterized membrane protein YgcG